MGSATREIAADHPCLAGHFPGRPIVPGALLLAEVLEALLADAATGRQLGAAPVLGAVKFLSAAGPGTRLRIDWQASATRVSFNVVKLDAAGNALTAKGHFECAGCPHDQR